MTCPCRKLTASLCFWDCWLLVSVFLGLLVSGNRTPSEKTRVLLQHKLVVFYLTTTVIDNMLVLLQHPSSSKYYSSSTLLIINYLRLPSRTNMPGQKKTGNGNVKLVPWKIYHLPLYPESGKRLPSAVRLLSSAVVSKNYYLVNKITLQQYSCW